MDTIFDIGLLTVEISLFEKSVISVFVLDEEVLGLNWCSIQDLCLYVLYCFRPSSRHQSKVLQTETHCSDQRLKTASYIVLTCCDLSAINMLQF